MKPILILAANLLLIIYFIMYFIDNRLWPEETGGKVRNIIFIVLLLYLCYDVVSIYILKKSDSETGFVYKVAERSGYYFMAAYTFIKPFQKELLTWTLIAGGIIVVSLILVGLPGGLLLGLTENLKIFPPIKGDNAWPAAIVLSVLWPISLPVSILVKHYLIRNNYTTLVPYSIGGTITVWIILMMVLTYVMFGKK